MLCKSCNFRVTQCTIFQKQENRDMKHTGAMYDIVGTIDCYIIN